MREWSVVALAALSLAACGAPPQGGTPVVSPPTGALVAWAAFPADQVPRPIVLIGNSSPQDGLSSGDAKIAAYCHKFKLGTTLPTAVPGGAQASWSSGTVETYPAISATAALAAMSQHPPGNPDPNCATVQPLVVTGARFDAFEYVTDRGRAQIYSWLFTVTGANGEMAYPAVAPSVLWNADLTQGSLDGGATVTADGTSLTFTFWGAPAGTGPCSADYKAAVAESHAAVAVAVQMISHAPPNTPVACPAIAMQRSITVTLASPLDGRVVVNAFGLAVPVCPASKRDC
jgi:hypothetical protein